jgi:primosomal protein N' (replication factor Y)
LVDFCAKEYHAELLKFTPEQNLLGPEYPPVARVRNRYNKNIIMKVDASMNLQSTKEKITEINNRFFKDKQFRSVRLIINVDPQ